MKQEYTVKSVADLEKISGDIWKNLEHKLVCFTGELGAGKTTLIKSLLKHKNCDDLASSPSYSLINEYAIGSKKIYHMDLYRLSSLQEALDIGILEYFDSGNWVFVEWPGIIESLLPEDFHQIKIEVLSNWERKFILI